MELSINKTDIVRALGALQGCISPRTAMPILGNVLIQASGGEVVVTTTDLDVTIQTSCRADVRKEGATTLPAKRLASIIKELPTEEFSLNVDEKHYAAIQAGPSRFKLIGITSDEFPTTPVGEDGELISLEQSALQYGLRMSGFAVSTDENRYILNGVSCELSDGKLKFVATDGRRLALAESPVEHAGDLSWILPKKTVNILQKILSSEGMAELRVSENRIQIKAGDYIVTSKLIEGNYPNYKQVIPSENREGATLSIKRDELLHVVRRMMILATELSSLKIKVAEDTMHFSSSSPDVGECREEINIPYKGESKEIALNHNFLAQGLSVMDADEVPLTIHEECEPAVIRTPHFIYVVMPMRQTGEPHPG